jgi:hypothetical protein
MPRSITTVTDELKITSSPAMGTPTGVQLLRSFQLNDEPPVHVFVAAFVNNKLKRKRRDSKNLFMLHIVLAKQIIRKGFQRCGCTANY